MKRHVLLTLLVFISISAISQGEYPLKQLTFDSAQQGFPSWSPDGEHIVFANTNKYDSLGNMGLWKMSLKDLKIIQIFEGLAEHPAWSPDNSFIAFDADTGKNICMISPNGGERINFLPENINIFRGGLPCWSPDGSMLAFLEGTTMAVWVYNKNTRDIKKIYQDETSIPMPGCWSREGDKVFLAARSQNAMESRMLKVDINNGAVEQINGPLSNFYRYIEISPDGSIIVYVAVNIKDRSSSLMAMPAGGGKSIEIVSPPGSNEAPCWSPDGSKIAFTSTRSGSFNVWYVEVNIENLKKELGII